MKSTTHLMSDQDTSAKLVKVEERCKSPDQGLLSDPLTMVRLAEEGRFRVTRFMISDHKDLIQLKLQIHLIQSEYLISLAHQVIGHPLDITDIAELDLVHGEVGDDLGQEL